jgi:hypothetical protein
VLDHLLAVLGLQLLDQTLNAFGLVARRLSTASPVHTATTSFTPTMVVSTVSSERAKTLRLSSVTTGPSESVAVGVVLERIPHRAPTPEIKPDDIGWYNAPISVRSITA